jgi:hypothetical protein
VPLTENPPREGGSYRDLIARAKARPHTPTPALRDIPRFDQLEEGRMTAPTPETVRAQKSTVSPATAAGLQALSGAQPASVSAPESPPKEPEEEPEEKNESEEDKLRRQIEARLKPLDVGQYLSTGEIVQEVVLVPDKLVVRYRSVSEYEEGWLDAHIAKQDREKMTGQQLSRMISELALAFHIHSVNNTVWPPTTDKNARVLDATMEDRLDRVRRLPSSVYVLLCQNMGWFVDRVGKSLTLQALGNG